MRFTQEETRRHWHGSIRMLEDWGDCAPSSAPHGICILLYMYNNISNPAAAYHLLATLAATVWVLVLGFVETPRALGEGSEDPLPGVGP